MTRPSRRAPPRIGRYRILGELGRGGMGVVYAAQDEHLQREVALKVLELGGLAAKGTQLTRFEREGKAVARLQHPNIVQVYDVGREDRSAWMAMELVTGETLDQRLAREGPFDQREATRLALGLAQALAHAHEAGILHRDLKPANVLLTPEGEPKVTDFGLARTEGTSRITGPRQVLDEAELDAEAEALTASGQLLGTPAYMSPEQARGDRTRIDTRADIYSLGATLYQVLTGSPPVEGITLVSVVTAVLEGRIKAPRERRPDLDPELERICLRCLEHDPETRYPTAKAVAEDLARFLKARPGSTVTPAALLVAAVGVLIAVALVWGWFGTPPAAPTSEEEPRQAVTTETATLPADTPIPQSETAPITTARPAPSAEHDVSIRRLDSTHDPIPSQPHVAPRPAPRPTPKPPRPKPRPEPPAPVQPAAPRAPSWAVQRATAPLDSKKVHWVTRWHDARLEARARNVPLVVVLLAARFEPPLELASDRFVRALNRNAVAVVGQPGFHGPPRRGPPGRPFPRHRPPRRVGACPQHSLSSCDMHLRAFKQIRDDGLGDHDLALGFDDHLRIYVCDPSGAWVKSVAGGRAGSATYRGAPLEALEVLKAARKRLGKPRIALSTLQREGRKLQEADDHRAQGRLVKAWKGYQALLEKGARAPEPLRAWALSGQARVKQRCRARVAEAQELPQPKPALERLRRELKGIPAARDLIRQALKETVR